MIAWRKESLRLEKSTQFSVGAFTIPYRAGNVKLENGKNSGEARGEDCLQSFRGCAIMAGKPEGRLSAPLPAYDLCGGRDAEVFCLFSSPGADGHGALFLCAPHRGRGGGRARAGLRYVSSFLRADGAFDRWRSTACSFPALCSRRMAACAITRCRTGIFTLLAGADIIIAGGRGLESFESTLQSLGAAGPVVALTLYNTELYNQDDEAADDEENSHLDGANPHLYMATDGARYIVEGAALALAQLYPAVCGATLCQHGCRGRAPRWPWESRCVPLPPTPRARAPS